LPFNHHHHHQIDITPLAISPYFGDVGLALVMVRPSPLLRSRQRLLKRKNPALWLHFSRDAGSKGCRVAMVYISSRPSFGTYFPYDRATGLRFPCRFEPTTHPFAQHSPWSRRIPCPYATGPLTCPPILLPSLGTLGCPSCAALRPGLPEDGSLLTSFDCVRGFLGGGRSSPHSGFSQALP